MLSHDEHSDANVGSSSSSSLLTTRRSPRIAASMTDSRSVSSHSLRGGSTGRPSTRRIRAINSSGRREHHRRTLSSAEDKRRPHVPSHLDSREPMRSCSDNPFNSQQATQRRQRMVLGELSLHQADMQAREVRDRKLKEEERERQAQEQQAQSQSLTQAAAPSPPPTQSPSPSISPQQSRHSRGETPSFDQSGTTADDSSILPRTPEDGQEVQAAAAATSVPRTPSKRKRNNSTANAEEHTNSSSPVSDENFDSPRAEREKREREMQAQLRSTRSDEVEEYLVRKSHVRGQDDEGPADVLSLGARV